jgi:hypothetical protein
MKLITIIRLTHLPKGTEISGWLAFRPSISSGP